MVFAFVAWMNLKCPNLSCPQAKIDPIKSPESRRIVRNGQFFRKSDSKWIRRFLCRECNQGFSYATRSSCFGQKRRRLNPVIERLLYSGVSQRQAARITGANLKTVVRKFRFLAEQATTEQIEYRERFKLKPVEYLQFDDLETSEHTKCKPLSVALAVDATTRKIIGFQVSQMPAKGPLAKIAIQKYGYRKDQRPKGWAALMKEMEPYVSKNVKILSDQNPHYPRIIKRHFPNAVHSTVKGRRGCGVGQGELKKIGYDPLFSLNHTCAMLRAHLNRLFRRTWCTTKKRERLADHIAIYVNYHNRMRTPASTG